jgi:hypothetical protein
MNPPSRVGSQDLPRYLLWRTQEHPALGFSFLPAAPVYWQATPTDYSPVLEKPISSAMSTPLSSSPR